MGLHNDLTPSQKLSRYGFGLAQQLRSRGTHFGWIEPLQASAFEYDLKGFH
jgi:hypothetical protein